MNARKEFRDYPFLEAIIGNKIKVIHLSIEYANQHQIILELNEKDKDGNYFYGLFLIMLK